MSILSTFYIGAQALKAHQLAVQTTGHNLANAATPGYSRQRVDIASATPAFEGGLLLGQGVTVTGVQRIVDRFIEAELVSRRGTVGFSEAEQRALTGVVEAFPTTGGIDAALSGFFGALSDLANNPAGQVERVSLISKANALGDSFRQTREILVSIQTSLDKDLEAAALRFNTLASQIATLNGQISASETANQPANDFRDQRQRLVQDLAHLTGATVREESDGQVTVLAGNLVLVSGNRAASLDTSTVGPTGFRALMFRTPDGLSFDATSMFTGGEIGATVRMRDVELVGVLGRLDQLAKTVADTINAQHSLGFDLDGVAGGNFFAPIAAVAGAAGLLRVSSAVVANPRLIAAAQTAAGVPGDNRNALALVNLQSTPIVALGNLSLKDYHLVLVGDVANRATSVEATLSFQKQFLTQTQARREAVSGVSIDEEMTKMILFQRTFEASSRLIRTSDEMYATILGMLR